MRLERQRARQYGGVSLTPPLPTDLPPDVGRLAPGYPAEPPALVPKPELGPDGPMVPPPPVHSLDEPSDAFLTRSARPSFGEVALGGGLLLVCLGLHIGAMFPPYPGVPANPVVSSSWEIAVYVCLEIGWALAAALVLSRVSVRGGAALGAGLGAVELGLLAADIANGFQVSDGSEAGAWLALAGLCFGAAGVLVSASTVPMGAPGVRRQPAAVLMVLVTFAAVATYLPSWDKWSAVAPSLHLAGSVTEGNAFSQPGPVMVGVLVTAGAIAFVTILGSFWAPVTVGSWATGGAVIALSSQLISAVFQLSEAVPSTAFGVSTAQARAIGLKTSASLTGWWKADVAATVALALVALWAALNARSATRDAAQPPWPPGLSRDGSMGGASEEWPAAHHWPRP